MCVCVCVCVCARACESSWLYSREAARVAGGRGNACRLMASAPDTHSLSTHARCRLEQLLVMGSLVMKEESGYYAFFHHLLRPNEHYVPVWKQRPEDVLEAMEWAKGHDEAAKEMAAKAQAVATQYLNVQVRAGGIGLGNTCTRSPAHTLFDPLSLYLLPLPSTPLLLASCMPPFFTLLRPLTPLPPCPAPHTPCPLTLEPITPPGPSLHPHSSPGPHVLLVHSSSPAGRPPAVQAGAAGRRVEAVPGLPPRLRVPPKRVLKKVD